MLYIFIPLSMLVSLLLLVYFFIKKIPIRLSVLLTVIAFTGIFLGFGLIIEQNNRILEARKRLSWPTTAAIILESKVVGDRAYRPDIIYEYFVDEKPYRGETDLKTPGFGARRSRRDTAERIIDEYENNSQITVYYNPDNPSESFVRPGPEWSNYMRFAVGNILLIISVFGFLGSLLSRLTINSKT